MDFEFDRAKSVRNRQKHGIDFVDAQDLWLDAARLIIPAKTTDEARFAIIAQWDHHFWTGIFTFQGTV